MDLAPLLLGAAIAIGLIYVLVRRRVPAASTLDRDQTSDADMRYVIWIRGPVLELVPNLASLATEFGSHGYAHREVGLDAAGRVIHRKPSTVHRRGDFGVLDSPPIDLDLVIERGSARPIDASEFEEIWLLPDDPLRVG